MQFYYLRVEETEPKSDDKKWVRTNGSFLKGNTVKCILTKCGVSLEPIIAENNNRSFVDLSEHIDAL